MKNVRKLIREMVRRELATNHVQPVRSPFSHYSYYNPGRPYSDTFQDVTQLYNTTYRAKHHSSPFKKVSYSEPLNILVAIPVEESEFKSPFVIFGLKAARGYGKDYRFLDKSIPGSGGYYISEEQANLMLIDTKKALRELNHDYMGLLGDVELSDQYLNEGLKREKAVSKAQQRFFGMVYAYKQGDLDLDDLDDDLADRVKKAADGISMSDAKDYAETDTEDLPQRAEHYVREMVREYILDNIPPPNSNSLVERIERAYGDDIKDSCFGNANRLAWSIFREKNSK